MASIGIASASLWDLRDEIGRALDATPVALNRHSAALIEAGRVEAILGPAGREGRKARRMAARLGLPFQAVEPGPFRCLRPDLPAKPLSLQISGAGHDGGAIAADCGASLARWDALRLSGRNDGRDRLPADLRDRSLVLVVAAERRRSHKAVEAARTACPDCPIVILNEGDETAASVVGSGGKGLPLPFRLNPHAVFDRAVRVFAPEQSRLGQAAQLALTRKASDRRDERFALFHTAFLDRVHYLDPWTREPIGFDEAAEKLAWLRDRFHENENPTICVGISGWKRRPVAAFLEGPDGPPLFESRTERAASRADALDGRVVAWATRLPSALPAACARAGVPLLRMEDGFLRSVGLGAAFRPGASIVLDGAGIYYDPTGPSDLERILAERDFTPDLASRAAALRRSIVAARLSKYNVGARGELALPSDRPIVLVPGQVEDDASVQRGSPVVRGNLALLRAAREANPDGFLIFKPHPDVAAGLRPGRVDDAEARRYADLVVTDTAIDDLLDRVATVETMTSLTGFEALLRGVAVTTHGQPFYAGWGLTTDRHPPPRRTRRLTLDELVAGTLILYPRYLDPVTGLRCEPELLVRRLAEARVVADGASASSVRARALAVRLRHTLLGPLATLLRRSRGAGPPAR